jgi:hypothetical protein
MPLVRYNEQVWILMLPDKYDLLSKENVDIYISVNLLSYELHVSVIIMVVFMK